MPVPGRVVIPHHTIKFGDKLYLITRRDIAPGYQAVQSAHALRQFSHEHPEIDREWFERSNHLALLSTKDESTLCDLIERAEKHGLRWSAFREPDIGDRVTAIAIEPHPRTGALCKGLPLALFSAIEA